GWPNAPLTATAPPEPVVLGRMLSRRAFVLTVVAIAIGALASTASYVLSRDQSIETATYIRYATVLTLGMYLAVGLLIVTQITPPVRLRWRIGGRSRAVATGLVAGVAPSLALLAAISAGTGHLAPDPRIVLMMSEGDATHIVAALLIGCAAAPLVE